MSNLIKLSEVFSPDSKYIQITCQGILRNNLFRIEEHEMVVEIEDVFDLMIKVMEKENKNR